MGNLLIDVTEGIQVVSKFYIGFYKPPREVAITKLEKEIAQEIKKVDSDISELAANKEAMNGDLWFLSLIRTFDIFAQLVEKHLKNCEGLYDETKMLETPTDVLGYFKNNYGRLNQLYMDEKSPSPLADDRGFFLNKCRSLKYALKVVDIRLEQVDIFSPQLKNYINKLYNLLDKTEDDVVLERLKDNYFLYLPPRRTL